MVDDLGMGYDAHVTTSLSAVGSGYNFTSTSLALGNTAKKCSETVVFKTRWSHVCRGSSFFAFIISHRTPFILLSVRALRDSNQPSGPGQSSLYVL